MSDAAPSPFLLSTSLIPLRWGDMDANQHVNNVLFFRFMEQARVEWLHQVDPKALRPPELAIMVVHVSCDFYAQLTYPGTVEVNVFAEQAGRTSVSLTHEIRLAGDPRLCARGRDKVVWVDTRISKAVPLRDEIRRHFP